MGFYLVAIGRKGAVGAVQKPVPVTDNQGLTYRATGAGVSVAQNHSIWGRATPQKPTFLDHAQAALWINSRS